MILVYSKINIQIQGQETLQSVDIVVPVYGNWELVSQCLLALQNQSVNTNIFVVDDCSNDDTPDKIASHFPDMTLLRNSTNLGFAKSCNRGISEGKSEFVILVNSDVTSDKNMVETLIEGFSKQPDVGSASPLLFKPNGLVDGFGITVDSTLSGFVRYAGESRDNLRRPFPAVVAAYGAVAAFRRAALQDVGLLDENIFMYGEELDLGLRLNASGWRCIAVPESTGVHLGGGSIGLGSARQRERAGFGRGYLLRSYGVLKSRNGFRALVTELIVSSADILLNRDFAAIKGRIAGWKAGRFAPEKPSIDKLTLANISFVTSLKLRGKMVSE